MLISEWIFVCMFESLLTLGRHIYQGIVFLCDGNEEENGGYVTAKAIMCEKVKLAVSVFSATRKV